MKSIEQRLQAIERAIGRIDSESSRVPSRSASPAISNPVRLARTYNNGAYPGASTANTFPATFIDGTFTESGGTISPTITERDTANIVFVHNVFDNPIPVGTKIAVVFSSGRWWTWYSEDGTGGDADNLVRIKNIAGSPATCDSISRAVATCHYSGKIVSLAGSPNFCSDPWAEGTDVWIFDSTRCDAPTQLKFNDVYHARKLSDSFEPSIGLGLRPLYVTRSDGPSGSDVKIIKTTSTSGVACDVASQPTGSECIWNAKLQSVDVSSATMCSPFSDGADVFAFKMSACCSTTIRKNEYYLGLKVGSFNSAGVGATRDTYAIIGSYCQSVTYPQLVYVNSFIAPDTSGAALLAHDSGGGPLATTASATALTIYNPFNGHLVSGMLVSVTQMQVEMVGAVQWCVDPVDLMYQAKSISSIGAGASGSVTIYKNGVSTGQTVTAQHNWIHGGKAIAGGGVELIIQWFRLDKAWRIIGATCS